MLMNDIGTKSATIVKRTRKVLKFRNAIKSLQKSLKKLNESTEEKDFLQREIDGKLKLKSTAIQELSTTKDLLVQSFLQRVVNSTQASISRIEFRRKKWQERGKNHLV
jgi:hypothetical protein